jgi:transposase InsO family protein
VAFSSPFFGIASFAKPDMASLSVRGRRTGCEPDILPRSDSYTHVPTCEGWLFLAAAIDACSRYRCGWSMRDDLKAHLVIYALGVACHAPAAEGRPDASSDRGAQYRSLALGERCASPASCPPGDAFDNAASESFMATFKTVRMQRERCKRRDNAARRRIQLHRGQPAPPTLGPRPPFAG